MSLGCETCKGWAANWTGLDLLSGHNPACPDNPAAVKVKAAELIERLVAGIEAWAAEGDGVPDEMWDAYSLAREVLGRPVKEAEAAQ